MNQLYPDSAKPPRMATMHAFWRQAIRQSTHPVIGEVQTTPGDRAWIAAFLRTGVGLDSPGVNDIDKEGV